MKHVRSNIPVIWDYINDKVLVFVLHFQFWVITLRSAGILNKTSYSSSTWTIIRNDGKLLSECVHIRFPPDLEEDWRAVLHELLKSFSYCTTLNIATQISINKIYPEKSDQVCILLGIRIIYLFSIFRVCKWDTESCSQSFQRFPDLKQICASKTVKNKILFFVLSVMLSVTDQSCMLIRNYFPKIKLDSVFLNNVLTQICSCTAADHCS